MAELTVALPSSVNAKYTKPAGGIPATDLAASVQAALTEGDVTTLPIVRWGDSLTSGWQGTNRDAGLYSALGRSSSTSGVFGIGGQRSDQIGARQGGAPAKVSAAITIPADTTAVALTPSIDLLQGTGVAVGQTRSIAAVIMGVAGTLTATNPDTTPWTYTFTRTTAGFAVQVPAGTPIQAGNAYIDHLPIIWSGRNSVNLADAATDIPALIERMLKKSRQRERALVLGIIPRASTDAIGTADRTTLDTVNAAIRDAFPAQFVDVGAWLRDPNVIAAVGYTLTTQDQTDITNGLTPTQLTSDGLHLNDAGYAVLNQAIIHEYRARGWAPSAAPAAPTVTTTTLAGMTAGVAFSQTLGASGTAPMTWDISAGTLPAGLSLSAQGVLSGTPTTAGAYDFTVRATNAHGNDTQQYTGTIAAATAWATFTSDGFSGDGPVYGTPNRSTDAALGGSPKVYVLGSSADRFVTSGGVLKSGSAPGFTSFSVATGFRDARASLKITEKLTSVTTLVGTAFLICAARSTTNSSGATELGVRVTQAATTQDLAARITLTDSGGTAVQSAASTPLAVGDVVGCSTEWNTAGTECTVKMWKNGSVVDTLTYTGTVPEAFAYAGAGHSTDTTWEIDDFKVEQLVSS